MLMRDSNKLTRSLRVLVIAFLVSSLVIFCDAADAGVVSSSVESNVEQLVTDGNIPSLHTCVVSGNEMSWFRAYGEQTDPDIVFLIGSIQKVFTAISILQLYESEIISLDEDVNTYLPFSLRHPDYPDSSITIRMLLSHHAGLTSTLPSEFCFDWEGGYTPEYRPYVRDYYASVVGIPLGEYLAMCLPSDGVLYSAINWAYEPDTTFSYSNIGYKVLNYILELQTNLTIQEYMQDNIFSPLRMNNTGFNASDFEGHHAFPYTRFTGNTTNTELPVWNGRYMIRSTVRDMGNLLIALMNSGQFNRFQMLEDETLGMMFINTCPTGLPKVLRKEFVWEGYGMGLEVRNHGIFGHGGSTVGFTAAMYFNPTTDLAYIRLSNVNTILDSNSVEWDKITEVHDEILTLIMTDIGMLPAFDALTVILIVVSSISVAAMVLGIRRSRRK